MTSPKEMRFWQVLSLLSLIGSIATGWYKEPFGLFCTVLYIVGGAYWTTQYNRSSKGKLK